MQLINKRKDWFLDELVAEMAKRTLKVLKTATKKRSEILRANYILTIGTHYNPEQLIFLDESSKDERTLSRHYGYSPKNTHAIQKVVFLRGTKYTILPALSLDGILAVDIMVGSYNKERFCAFILSQVLPLMNLYPQKNSVLVMDNAVIHHNVELVRIIKSIGCKVVFLPLYSPDYNPIELAFSVIKSWLKKKELYRILFRSLFCFQLLLACEQVTPDMTKEFYKSSIYLIYL
ncbi:homeodomain-like protein [Rhizophagus clarus]|uniref:Homeodomain-like protein n=1 Tax=Rhizophagus clarus TaxID=94130 RepID=A0A8H3M5T0_9GLOM|nr:homeodomain-like protein [Rhizophagus clarus]